MEEAHESMASKIRSQEWQQHWNNKRQETMEALAAGRVIITLTNKQFGFRVHVQAPHNDSFYKEAYAIKGVIKRKRTLSWSFPRWASVTVVEMCNRIYGAKNVTIIKKSHSYPMQRPPEAVEEGSQPW